MEEVGDNMETSSSCKRQRVCEEQVEDRITSLPDSILIHILSFLPMKDAVRTVLVPRFRHLWQFLTKLTFNHSQYVDSEPTEDGPFHHEKFLDFVRHVLILHRNSTIDKFVLRLGINFFYSKRVAAIPGYKDFANTEKRMASEVDSWVYFAMRKEVKVLSLECTQGLNPQPDASYRVPSVVFRGKYLSELELVGCEIKPSGQIQLNCLKQLLLEDCVLNNEILNQILGGCSVLEELHLIRCYGLCRLGFRNSSIKTVTLCYPFNEKRLEISCPNVETLCIAGRLDFVDLVDVSSVVMSFTAFSDFIYSPRIYKKVEAVFKNLGKCKEFIPTASCIMVFSIWQLRKQPDLQFGWKRLEFQVELTKWYLPGISCLLRTSPYLETLAMSIHPKDDRTYTVDEWMKRYDFDGRNFWKSQEGTFHCLKYHLKTIKMYFPIPGPYVIDIIEYLLMNAMVLEKFEISTQKCFRYSHLDYSSDAITPEQRQELSQKLFSLPRASPRAVGEWMKRYDFDEGNFWSSQEGTFHCLKYYLESNKMYFPIAGPYMIDIIEYLLKNAMVLEKFEISTQKCFRHSHLDYSSGQKVAVTPEQRQELSQKLLRSLPRASSSAVILFT